MGDETVAWRIVDRDKDVGYVASSSHGYDTILTRKSGVTAKKENAGPIPVFRLERSIVALGIV